MDGFRPCRNRRLHDVLSSALPETNRRRTDYADWSDIEKPRARTAAARALKRIYGCELEIRQIVGLSTLDGGFGGLRFGRKTGVGPVGGEAAEQMGALQRACRRAVGRRRAHDESCERTVF